MRWDTQYDVSYQLQSLPNIYFILFRPSLLPQYPWTPQSPSLSPTSLSLYHLSSTVLCQAEWWWWWEMHIPAKTPPCLFVRTTPSHFRITIYAHTEEHQNTTNKIEKHKCRLKVKSINPKENRKPKGKLQTQRKTINPKENPKLKRKTSRLSHLTHLLSVATVCICNSFALTTSKVWDIGKQRIELNYRFTHRVDGCWDMFPDLCKQLSIFVYCVLEHRYGFVPHYSVVVCQYLCLIVQHSLEVRVKPKPF